MSAFDIIKGNIKNINRQLAFYVLPSYPWNPMVERTKNLASTQILHVANWSFSGTNTSYPHDAEKRD